VLEVETVIPMLLQPSHDGALGGQADGGGDDDDDEDGVGGGGCGKSAGCRLQVKYNACAAKKKRYPLCRAATRYDSKHAPDSMR